MDHSDDTSESVKPPTRSTPRRNLPPNLPPWTWLAAGAAVVLVAIILIFLLARPPASAPAPGSAALTATAAAAQSNATTGAASTTPATLMPAQGTPTLTNSTATAQPPVTGTTTLLGDVASQLAPRLVLKGHIAPVWGVALSPDGGTVASGGEDQTVRLWNSSDGQILQTLQGHKDKVWSVAFSPDGRMVASTARDATVRLWSVPEGAPVRTLESQAGSVHSVAFSPDGALLAAGFITGTVKLWQVSDGALRREIKGHTKRVNSLAFSPDGKWLFSASVDATISIQAVDGEGKPQVLAGHSESVNSIALSPDGKTLVSVSDDNTLRFWQVENGEARANLARNGPSGKSEKFEGVAFGPDGSVVASVSHDSTDVGFVRIWRVRDGQLLVTQNVETPALSVAFGVGGLVASGDNGKMVRLWQVSGPSTDTPVPSPAAEATPSATAASATTATVTALAPTAGASASSTSAVTIPTVTSPPRPTSTTGTPTVKPTLAPTATEEPTSEATATLAPAKPTSATEVQVGKFTIGESVNGAAITGTRIGTGDRVVVIAAALHGTEANGAVLLDTLVDRFSNMGGEIPGNVSFYFVPRLNPDGVKAGTRYNANGVDLNRNWNTNNWQESTRDAAGTHEKGGGSGPFSEPETKAFSNWLLARKAESSERLVALSYHAAANLVQPGYTLQGGKQITDVRAAALARKFAATVGYTYTTTWGAYPITGEFIHWCADNAISCFDIELPTQGNLGTVATQKHLTAILDIVK